GGPGWQRARADPCCRGPAHPSTHRLRDSVPGPGGELRDIRGEVPSLIGPPEGCRFHPRCEYATTECGTSRPAETALTDRHAVRCHHPVVAGDDVMPPRHDA